MSLIARYQKKGGFIQLLQLIETSSVDKREKLLKMISEENEKWATELSKKSISMKKLHQWKWEALAEVLAYIAAPFVAPSISLLSPEEQTHFLRALDPKERRKVEDILKDRVFQPAEVTAAQIRLISDVRTLFVGGKLKWEKIDAELAIADDVEEILNSEKSAAAVESVTTAASLNNAEMGVLQRRVAHLQNENQQLRQQIVSLKERFDQIRKLAA